MVNTLETSFVVSKFNKFFMVIYLLKNAITTSLLYCTIVYYSNHCGKLSLLQNLKLFIISLLISIFCNKEIFEESLINVYIN